MALSHSTSPQKAMFWFAARSPRVTSWSICETKLALLDRGG